MSYIRIPTLASSSISSSYAETASLSDLTLYAVSASYAPIDPYFSASVSLEFTGIQVDSSSFEDRITGLELATTESYAVSSSYALSASYAYYADESGHALTADSASHASYAEQAGLAESVESASHALYADEAGYALTAESSSHALYADEVAIGAGSYWTGSSGYISRESSVQVTGSFGVNVSNSPVFEVDGNVKIIGGLIRDTKIITSDYTTSLADNHILADSDSSQISILLNDPVDGFQLSIKRTGYRRVWINSPHTIDGETSILLRRYDNLDLLAYSNAWYII